MEPIPGCVAGIEVLVSSKAAAGCAEGGLAEPARPSGTRSPRGLAYRWVEGFAIFAGCDLSPYKAAVGKAAAQRAMRGGGSLGFDVPPGAGQVNVAIAGAGAAPRVTITGPGGETVTSAATPGGTATGTAGIVTQDEADATAYAALPKPRAGHWTVAPGARLGGGDPGLAGALAGEAEDPGAGEACRGRQAEAALLAAARSTASGCSSSSAAGSARG